MTLQLSLAALLQGRETASCETAAAAPLWRRWICSMMMMSMGMGIMMTSMTAMMALTWTTRTSTARASARARAGIASVAVAAAVAATLLMPAHSGLHGRAPLQLPLGARLQAAAPLAQARCHLSCVPHRQAVALALALGLGLALPPVLLLQRLQRRRRRQPATLPLQLQCALRWLQLA